MSRPPPIDERVLLARLPEPPETVAASVVANTADAASITGGRTNVISGAAAFYPSITGAEDNVVTASHISANGGSTRTAADAHGWAGGSITEDDGSPVPSSRARGTRSEGSSVKTQPPP